VRLARVIRPALLGLVLAGPVYGQSESAPRAEREIRARRASSNAAIARHDTAGFAAILAPDVVSVTSASARNLSKAAVVKSMADRFRDRPDVGYVREPDDVIVFLAWGMASEEGKWRGWWTDPDGKIAISGTYFAKWRLVGGQWFVESETYVPDKCTGGKFCTIVP
jgi:hypothetical protein